MGKPANNEFDPKAFLAKVGTGKTILKLEKNRHASDVAARTVEAGDKAELYRVAAEREHDRNR